MGRGWTLLVLGWALVLGGGFLAHRIQTADGVRVQDVRFAGADGTPMSGLLYIPPTASPQTPAPGVLAVHGYINSRETQDGFAIEFARRGYVVLAIDQAGHGYSGGTVAANGYGGPDGLRYLRSLAMVDPDQIGLEGHSMGGWAVLAAAMAQPSGYRAMVLEGSATGVRLPPAGTLASAPGTPQFPKNLAVVYSRWDEFAPLMWGVPRAAEVGRSAKLMALFGTSAPVVSGRIYGSVAAGDARTLYTPATTHPGDHISPTAIGDAVDWFARTLKGGTPRPADDQIWPWKEAATLIALAGVVLAMLGAFELALGLPAFRALVQPGEPARPRRGAGWWAMLAASALIPPLTFYPFMLAGMFAAPPSRAFPQAITNQLMAWALLNGAITLGASVLLGGGRGGRSNRRWAASAGVALLAVGMAYLAVLASDFLFKTDARFWIMALKLMSPRQFGGFLAYLVPFTAYFVIALGSLEANLMVRGDSPARQYATALAALAGGFLLFLLAQYVPLFVQGALPIPAEALNAIISIQLVPLMALVAVIAVFAWRRTNSALPGAFVCGLFVTWYVVAGQPFQFPG